MAGPCGSKTVSAVFGEKARVRKHVRLLGKFLGWFGLFADIQPNATSKCFADKSKLRS